MESRPSIEQCIGRSDAMQKVHDTVRRVAGIDVDVLILGETGTGKELVARSVHELSSRGSQPFVPINCGAIPDNLLESELFGYERGAFTGADRPRQGLLESANGGTFFLDEIGDLPAILQAKLLRVLQERKLRRVGGNAEVEIDVRIVAATARDLDQMVQAERFREDLFYRINVVRIDLPPLRERGDDLGLLAESFAERFSRDMGRPVPAFSPQAWSLLRRHHWPGNVRELQNVIRRAITLTDRDVISPDDLPVSLLAAVDQSDTGQHRGFIELRNEYVARFEREYFISLLKRHNGHVQAATTEAGLPRGTIYRLMKRHGIDPADYRSR